MLPVKIGNVCLYRPCLLTYPPCLGKLCWGSGSPGLKPSPYDSLRRVCQRRQEICCRGTAGSNKTEADEVVGSFSNRAKVDLPALIQQRDLVEVLVHIL